jgi:hypothetical protein
LLYFEAGTVWVYERADKSCVLPLILPEPFDMNFTNFHEFAGNLRNAPNPTLLIAPGLPEGRHRVIMRFWN